MTDSTYLAENAEMVCLPFDFFAEIERVTNELYKEPPMNLETRAEMIARWERDSRLDPNCPGCKEFYAYPGLPSDVFAPSHKASSGCESGKRPHCTCDTCF